MSAGEALLVRGGEGVNAEMSVCRLAPRLTTHVRHRQKYVDVPVAERSAFDFTDKGGPIGVRARTLAELAALARDVPPEVVQGHLRRNDFSRWIGDVFGYHLLAAQVRAVEAAVLDKDAPPAAARLACLIEERYLPSDSLCGPCSLNSLE
jgi:hypothetical protein